MIINFEAFGALISIFYSGLTHLALAEVDLEVLAAVALDSCEVLKLSRFVLCSRAIFGSMGHFQLLLLSIVWSYLWL